MQTARPTGLRETVAHPFTSRDVAVVTTHAGFGDPAINALASTGMVSTIADRLGCVATGRAPRMIDYMHAWGDAQAEYVIGRDIYSLTLLDYRQAKHDADMVGGHRPKRSRFHWRKPRKGRNGALRVTARLDWGKMLVMTAYRVTDGVIYAVTEPETRVKAKRPRVARTVLKGRVRGLKRQARIPCFACGMRARTVGTLCQPCAVKLNSEPTSAREMPTALVPDGVGGHIFGGD